MVEYSVVSHALLIGGGVLLLPVMDTLWNAVNAYLDSLYFVISAASL